MPKVVDELYNTILFQRPKKKRTPVSDAYVWCDNLLVDERFLGEEMKQISRQAEPSRSTQTI